MHHDYFVTFGTVQRLEVCVMFADMVRDDNGNRRCHGLSRKEIEQVSGCVRRDSQHDILLAWCLLAVDSWVGQKCPSTIMRSFIQ